MTLDEVMKALERAGTAQNRKVYVRHGVGANQYGVSFAALGALAKKIRTDHALAEALWATGNHDARILATMIADPSSATPRFLDTWARDLDNYVVTDAFAKFAARGAFARDRAEKWAPASGEWIGRAGWVLVACLAMGDEEIPDSYFAGKLALVEREIHGRKNYVRAAMNNALIAIGSRNAALTALAFAAAKRIGKVVVDHGETGCRTPDAIPYIEKMLARKKARAPQKAAAKKSTPKRAAAARGR